MARAGLADKAATTQEAMRMRIDFEVFIPDLGRVADGAIRNI
jgi:hypothetical protein